jgi:hypothetical protein
VDKVEIKTLHHFSNGVYAKEMHIPMNHHAQTHKHSYDHMSILAKGKVGIFVNENPEVIYEAPACIEIKAGISHTINAYEAAVWFCIHKTTETDEKKVDSILIEKNGE